MQKYILSADRHILIVLTLDIFNELLSCWKYLFGFYLHQLEREAFLCGDSKTRSL